MKFLPARYSVWPRCVALMAFCSALLVDAQPARPREFPPGSLNRIEELPASRLRTRLEKLSPAARQMAIEHLKTFHFTELDLKSLDVDGEGGIFYADEFTLGPAQQGAQSGPTGFDAVVPVKPFPSSLVFHSKPGASSTLYLNFIGETVSNTAWNSTVGKTSIPALPFSIDSDFTTFSDAEQVAIKRIWERVSEDYAPFDIDVTTEATESPLGIRTVDALVTRSTDADGSPNPSSSAGGIAYVGVFGVPSYIRYRPAWIYYDNLGYDESNIAEGVSHEAGHNFGLSHDGKTDGSAYYGGHGSGDTSWAPIMGTGFGHNVSQWSKGEYYTANNTQDDLVVITSKVAYRADDHGDTIGMATPLTITGLSNIVSTTPETDPTNVNRANKGIIERNTDVDVFVFTNGNGIVRLNVNPWISPSGTRGGNLDVSIELRNSSGAIIATNNPASTTTASIQTTLSQGTYYLFVRNTGVGNPMSSAPDGYTSYASLGQYFIDGSTTPTGSGTPLAQLTTTVNNALWGSINPSGGNYATGSTIQVTAVPASYYRFVKWTNGVAGTNNPFSLTMRTNVLVGAVFAEIFTTNNPTPYWWLASYGYTGNFETIISSLGANGMPLWQSYLCGLNPRDPSSQLRITATRNANGAYVLNWNTVTGRSYTISWGTNLMGGFTIINGASNLPSTVKSFTNSAPTRPSAFYRLTVQ